MASQESELTAQLLTRWKGGNDLAVDELYYRFLPLLQHRIKLRMHSLSVRGDLGVEDVVQETWLRVVKSGPEKFHSQGSGSFARWLSTISDATLVDLVRQRTRQKRGGDQPLGELQTADLAGAPGSPGGALRSTPSAKLRRNEFVEIARKTLTEREFTVWAWVAVGGYSIEEAALGQDTSTSAIRGLMLRSRHKLKEVLGPEESS
jgi:RNA polymerase sigma factor (sigma-70 family)